MGSRPGSKRGAILPALAIALAVPAAAAAQEAPPAQGPRIHRSVPPPGAKTHIVVPGERFRASGSKRWFYGDNYRDLWTTPIEVAVLDLDAVGGGLTPLRTGGFGQSVSLHFTGEDGRRYTVRSLDKDPTKRLEDDIKNSIVGEVLQDLISTLMPAAALVVDPLMEATGILHSKHTLVVIPDDPRLGEYREEFAGLIGTLQEHPSEGPDDSPGFAGSRKVSGTETVWEDMEEGRCDRIDARAYLKARLMDLLINDKDRHPGQWRWARFPDGECHTWLPIPEDRDQAFIHYGGVAMMLVRRTLPRAIPFDDTYPNLLGLTMTGWDLDRQFLAGLDRPAWREVVEEFRAELPDPVIEDAVRRLPEPYYELVGESLETALKARRDALPEFVDHYYDLITPQVEIQATDQDEYATAEHLANGDLLVRIGRAGDGDEDPEPPWFERTFRHEETREVRIYLRGGSDRAEVSGADGAIAVRVDGGGGSDTFTNTSAAGASKTHFYDHRGRNRFVEGKGASVDERPYQRPSTSLVWSRYAFDWGMESGTRPLVWADPDLGVFARVIHSRKYFGFRKDPFATRHYFDVGLASRGFKPFVSYVGTFRHVRPEIDARLAFEYSGFEVTRFKGFGNDFRLKEPSAYYKVEQRNFVFTPALEYRRGTEDVDATGDGTMPLRSELTVSLGPVIQWSNTPTEANRDFFIGALDEPVYGTGAFGQLGVRGEVEFDNRDNPAYATRGFLARVSAAGYPGVWDVESPFGNVDVEARTYLTANMALSPTLALRAGGKKVWGTYPFHESAFLGGPGRAGLGQVDGPLRGFHKNRFAGDASLYANVELRLALARINVLVPGEFGLFGAADVGRVYFADDPADADDWHNGTGGGFWLSFLERRTTMSVAVMKGRDMTGVYFRAGYMF
ncbi:MAG: hypothetical protein OXI45_04175 [Acidobacteriota bacterium]|nr:hypothetical protein [Acidobacteriota bacterium]